MKITKKDILDAIYHTPASLDRVFIDSINNIMLGFHIRNWSWKLHAISVDNSPMIVASRFGRIVAKGEVEHED